MSESLKQEVERAIGDNFVNWYNKEQGSSFVFERLGDDPPDLVYQAGKQVLPIEVTTAYYGSEDAKMRWKTARRDPSASDRWSGLNPEQSLVANVTDQISKKCVGKHDPGTVLVVGLYPALTTRNDFEKLKSEISIPQTVPFAQIYAGGNFPSGSGSAGGYFYFRLK